ncbi:MAG TPA: hypothetical protein PLB45_01700 [Bacilli bacterium]|jgi:hypothetical protein|nr:hypothetical protein [Bacilli bacterium]HPZ23481.1 hypothetical protein [Bacilli bacterium]HQC83573.1 hypothetical protein [Bacilli bacterium]
MKIESYLKKRLSLFIISFTFIVLLTIGSTFAMLNSKSDKVNEGSDLEIVYENKNNNLMSSTIPMTKEDGLINAIPNVIHITNSKNYNIKYSLKVTSENNNTLGLNKMYYSINSSDVQLLSDSNDNIIYEDVIEPDEVVTLNVRVWVGLDLITNDDQGKSLDLKYSIIEDK